VEPEAPVVSDAPDASDANAAGGVAPGADASVDADASESGPEMIQLALPQQVEIKTLIEYVSRRMDINIQYDEAIARKKVTLLAPAKIPKDSVLDLLQSVLKMADLALVDAEQEGWKKVVPVADAGPAAELKDDIEELKEVSPVSIVSQMFTLEHITVEAGQRTIEPFLSKPGGNVFVLPEQNLLIVTDYAVTLKRVAELLAMVDRPGPRPTMQFVPVEHLQASELARRVTELLKQKRSLIAADERQAGMKTVITHEDRTNQIVLITAGEEDPEALALIRALDIPSDAVTRKYYLQYVSPDRINQLVQKLISTEERKTQYKSAIDAESGLLIVSAPLRIHEQIESLAEQLDVAETTTQQSHIQFYKLMNTTAMDVLATIRSMEGTGIDLGLLAKMEGGSADAADGFVGPNRPPPAVGEPLPEPPAYKPSEDNENKDDKVAEGDGEVSRSTKTKDAVITADEKTNTIIVVAPPPVQRLYERLIKVLDKRQPQVLIEVTLVTIDTSGGRSFGVEISRKNERGTSEIGGQEVTNSELMFSSFGLSEIDQDTGVLTLRPGIGFNGVMVSVDAFNMVIRALATDGDARVLSAPRVLVNDNATATLSSVSEAPFSSVNASSTVSTTSFGGYASAGTTVSVTPHISQDNYLQLEYSITLNSFSGEASGDLPPPRQTNNLNSEVTIPDGHAIIVGGLTRKDESRTAKRLPWIGELPVLEYIFGSHSKNESQSTLFAFIRPIILRDDEFEDLKYLSARDLEAARLPPNFPASEPMLIQ
jgi:type II secretory pathway component GspD/PulD (secretin)